MPYALRAASTTRLATTKVDGIIFLHLEEWSTKLRRTQKPKANCKKARSCYKIAYFFRILTSNICFIGIYLVQNTARNAAVTDMCHVFMSSGMKFVKQYIKYLCDEGFPTFILENAHIRDSCDSSRVLHQTDVNETNI